MMSELLHRFFRLYGLHVALFTCGLWLAQWIRKTAAEEEATKEAEWGRVVCKLRPGERQGRHDAGG